MGIYDRGVAVRMVGSFIASSAASPFMVEPASVYCTVENPIGSIATYSYVSGVAPSVLRTATGAYYSDVVASVPGTWQYAFSDGLRVRAVGRFTIRFDDIL